MSNGDQLECELHKVSRAEPRQICEWLDDVIEDKLVFTPEFEYAVHLAERNTVNGKSARVREPQRS